MPKVLVDNRKRFSTFFSRTDQAMINDLEEVSRDIGLRLFANVMRRQPVNRYKDPIREERPSVRQGLVPIHQGWKDSPRVQRVSENAVEILLVSESEHIQYFTDMMGRRGYLGTRHSRGVWAGKNKDWLVFAQGGQTHFKKWVNHHGFSVGSDFVEEAWKETNAKQLLRQGMTIALRNAVANG